MWLAIAWALIARVASALCTVANDNCYGLRDAVRHSEAFIKNERGSKMNKLFDIFHGGFFLSGFALMATGAIMALLRNVPTRIVSAVRHYLTVTVYVSDRDEAFKDLRMWLHRHPYSKTCRNLEASIVSTVGNRVGKPLDNGDEGQWEVIFTPGEGTHLLTHRGMPIWLTRGSQEGTPGNVGAKERWIRMSALGKSSAPILGIIEEAVAAAHSNTAGTVPIYAAQLDYWQLVSRSRPRPVESVVLPDGTWDMVLSRCKQFLESGNLYLSWGIPYRMGMLLYGIPGSGKSSAVLALGGHLQMPIYMLSLGSTEDRMLGELFHSVQDGSIVLIEDVDAAFKKGRSRSEDNKAVTFAGLLNAIDGIASGTGRILCMTTNHLDRIDAALLRPGRVDVKIELGYATAEQIRRLHGRFYPDADARTIADFVAGFPAETSMATVQEALLARRAGV